MTDGQIDKALECCAIRHSCTGCPYKSDCVELFPKDMFDYVHRLKESKNNTELRLTQILSALYHKADDDKGFTVYRKDIVELAKDY